MNIPTRRQNRLFIGTIILVHVVYFLLACGYKHIYMGDSMEYVYEAINIKQHFFFYSGNPTLPIEPEYMTQRQPLYPLLLAGVYTLSLSNWLVLVLQHVLSVWNIVYTRRILLRLGYNARYDWLLLLLLLAYPAQFINASTIAPDILLQSFTLIYAGSFIQLWQTGQRKYALYMSVALIAGMLVKPVLYPFAIVHITIIVAVGLRQKKQMLLPMLLPLLAVLGYNYDNYLRTGKFHYSSNQAFNAIYYYYPYMSSHYGADSARHYLQNERAAIAAMPNYKDRYDYANSEGSRLLSENLVPYLLFHLKHSARIFIEPGKAEMDLFTGRLTYGGLYSKKETGFFATIKQKGIAGMGEYISSNPSLLIALLVLLFNCIRAIGLVLFFATGSIDRGIRMFMAMLMGYFAIAAGPIANTRYFLPVSLLAIGCSVLGYMKLIEKRRAR